MSRSLIALMFIACLHESAAAQALEIKREEPFTLPAAQQLVLHSKTLGRDVMVRIAPPAGLLPAGQRAAAVYMLDGNIGFGLASDTLRMMAQENQTFPAYLIAIGYDTANPMEISLRRDYDYLHTVLKHPADEKGMGGGGAAYEAFLTEELKPFVEKRLAVDPDRSVLAGFSHGGLFVSNVAARRPDAFAGYIIGSPSVWADANVISAASKANGSGRAVYLSVGEKEVSASINMVADTAKLGDGLGKAGYAVTSRVHQGQTHAMEPNIWMAEGFRVLLARPKIQTPKP
jgi:predicted alpha/beta superfamily hydrolase